MALSLDPLPLHTVLACVRAHVHAYWSAGTPVAVCPTVVYSFALVQVKFGPIVSVAAGSIGGTTFQRSQIAPIVRSKPLPIRRRTSYTNQPRGTMGQWSRTWRTLRPTERTDWQTAADLLTWVNKFGDVIRGKGYWLYLRCNQVLSTLQLASVSSPGTPVVFTGITGLTSAGSVATTCSLSWSAPDPTETGTAWMVFATQPMSAGRSTAPGAYRYIGRIGPGRSSPQVIGSLYDAKFGGVQKVGQRTFFRVQVVDLTTGDIGPVAETDMVWT